MRRRPPRSTRTDTLFPDPTPVRSTVALASGARLSYDALVLATGGRAYLPPVPGFGLDCVHTLRTLADARRLRASLKAGARVLVVGRSEEHTSELQSLMRISYAVFCLKKKNKT